MNKPKSITYIILGTLLSIALCMLKHESDEQDKLYEIERKSFQDKVKNAECSVKRDNNIDLVGVKCFDYIDGNVLITTLTDKQLFVHPSRVVYNDPDINTEEAMLLKPYKEE